MRSFFPACCLALLCAAAFAAVGDENWGEEIVLLPPESEIQIHVFADDEEDIRVDGTGRFWALYSQGNPTGQQLATWEEGQWRPTALLGDGIIPAMLLDGPDGSLICVWNAGMVQVMGLRALHSSGQLPPQNRIQIFKDTRGQFWAHLVPDTGQARFAFPSESDPLVSVPFPNPMFSSFSTPVILPAFRDGKGRFWFPLNEFMSMQLGPCLACVLPDVALKLHPSGEDGWDSSTCWPSMVSFSPSGEVVPVNGKPSFRGGDQFYQPREARLFPLSGETFLFSDRGVMLWRRDGTGAYFTPVYPKDMEKMSQRDTRMNVNAALSREGRIWLATDAALFSVEEGGEWTRRVDGHCVAVWEGRGGVWAAFSISLNISAPLMAFVPDGGGEPVLIRHPCGLPVASIEMCRPGVDGGVVVLEKERRRVYSFSSAELDQLLASHAEASSATEKARVFPAAMPMIGPDGHAYLAAASHEKGVCLHDWNGGEWRETVLAEFSKHIRHSYMAITPYSAPPPPWCLLEKGGKVWVVEEEEEGRLFVVDLSNGSVETDTLMEALKQRAASIGAFVGGSPPSGIVPKICADGRVLFVDSNRLHCLIEGEWRRFEDSELELGGRLSGAMVYVDDKDRICISSDGLLQVLAPGERFFRRQPAPAPPAPSAFRVKASGRDSYPALTFRLLNEAIHRKGCYRDRYTLLPREDSLGMTWEVKDGALVCSAHGLESVVCPASPSSPFNTWGCFREVRRSFLGGVFLSPAYRQVLFVPTAPFPADTRAALSQDGEGRQVLAFSTEGEGLRHAWRVDRGPWQATEQAEAVVGVLPPGPHLVEVYAFDTQLNADTTPASFSLGAAPEAVEEAPAAPAFPLEVAEVVSAPLVAPDGGVYVLARNEARETLLRRWDGKEWREQPAGGAPEQPDTPPEDLFIPSSVEPDELALADDGRVWVYEGGFPQRGFILSFADGTREYFRFLRERLEDPAARPVSFRPAEGRHTAPVLCPDGRVALRMGLRLFCLENGAWRGFRLDTLDKRPVFPWEPFPLGVDGQGRLRVEKAGVCFTLAAGAAAFEPCVPLPEPSERGTQPEREMPPPPGPCIDTFGMAWRVGDRGLVCALGEEELVVVPPGESLPFLGQEDLELVLRPPCGGVLALARTGKLAVFPPSGDAPATAARAEARDNAVIQLAMTTPGEGVRHVWRVDGGPWALAQGPEAETPPLPPGTHTVEVCAFSGLMSADPTPERFSLEIAPQNDIATLSAALAAGGARGLWALDQLKSMGAEGLALAKARLAATTDPGERWALEAAVQWLEKAASAEAAPTGQP